MYSIMHSPTSLQSGNLTLQCTALMHQPFQPEEYQVSRWATYPLPVPVLLLLLAAQSIFVLWSTLVALYYAVSVHSKEDPPASISRHPPSQREPAFKSTKYLFIWRTGLSLIKSVHPHRYLHHFGTNALLLREQTGIFLHQRQFKLEVTFPENEFSITRPLWQW